MLNRILLKGAAFLASALLFFSCATGAEHGKPILPQAPELGIVGVPPEMGSRYTTAFDRYTEVVSPNGGKIRIVAQNRITNDQILRARDILNHYLTDVPGSAYGASKGKIADKMAANGAILTLLNGRDDGSNKTAVGGQSLFEEELPVEGDTWYIDCDYSHRDAAFEEILHLVHDYGIGVDGTGGTPGAAPEFQKAIRTAQEQDLTAGIWAAGMDPKKGWLKEIIAENSQTQEYLAAVIDSWYGLWAPWNDPSEPNSKTRGMWGFYLPKTRAEVKTENPRGAALAEGFFTPYLAGSFRIAPSFKGTFDLNFNPATPYTHKSRYLKDITLTGKENSSVRVSSRDNNLTGNAGTNAAVFTGPRTDYEITKSGSDIIVRDTEDGRDGTNTLTNFEILRFTDGDVKTAEL